MRECLNEARIKIIGFMRDRFKAAGLALGMELLKGCDEIWVFGSVKGGMIAEVQKAGELGIKVVFMLKNGGEWTWPKA